MDDSLSSSEFESLLSEDSDKEFGMPDFKESLVPNANPSKRGNLKDWTAQDFASIHVRFRPHLERHARKFISNPLQAEEVVQDAFLYLMTSLPEIDNEVGVLKFLKWKIKMLSLDILQSARVQREQNSDDFDAFVAEDADLLSDFERAEDNAVIRLALSKLSPRQRDALVASVYEEKTSAELAGELGLSENATRQLVFRARSAFRKALVGEAEIKGKTVGQILNIAAKKAALDAKKYSPVMGSIILVSAITLGLTPYLNWDQSVNDEASMAVSPLSASRPSTQADESMPSTPPNQAEESDGEQQSGIQPLADAPLQDISATSEELGADSNVTDFSSEISFEDSGAERTPEAKFQAQVTSQPLSTTSLAAILETDTQQAGFYTDSYASIFGDLFEGVSVEVFGGTGISAFLDIDPMTQEITKVFFQMRIDGEIYLGVGSESVFKKSPIGTSTQLFAESRDFYVVDSDGNVFSDSPLANSIATVTLDLDSSGGPTAASLALAERP